MKKKFIYIHIIQMTDIPLNIFQTWHTKKLPPFMAKNIENLQKINPEFKYQLFDDKDCLDFIHDNYDTDVLNAYNMLIPGAFKADLWRYCILYKYGGIYLDIKYKCINDFKLISLTNKENLVQDIHYNGVYNTLIICLPNNDIMMRCINKIVENVKSLYYGESFLSVIGPNMLYSLLTKIEISNLLSELQHLFINGKRIISYKGTESLEEYPEYRYEQNIHSITDHYANLWNNRNIYNYNIPLNIFQTWHTKNLPPFMAKNIENLQKINPEFKYQLFDDKDCLDFIKMNYSKDVLDAFILLKPGAYKADLWRYCILYKYGGIYLDIKFESVNDFKLITLLEKKKVFFVQDNIHNGIYNAFMICQPNNDILLRCISTVIKNVKNRFYGRDRVIRRISRIQI
jgi:mannosyltransferase OCH1-like enzyme